MLTLSTESTSQLPCNLIPPHEDKLGAESGDFTPPWLLLCGISPGSIDRAHASALTANGFLGLKDEGTVERDQRLAEYPTLLLTRTIEVESPESLGSWGLSLPTPLSEPPPPSPPPFAPSPPPLPHRR